MKTYITHNNKILGSSFCTTVCELNNLVLRCELALETNLRLGASTKVLKKEREVASLKPKFKKEYKKRNTNEIEIELTVKGFELSIQASSVGVTKTFYFDLVCEIFDFEYIDNTFKNAMEISNHHIQSHGLDEKLYRI